MGISLPHGAPGVHAAGGVSGGTTEGESKIALMATTEGDKRGQNSPALWTIAYY
jgi:hypothetical protein